MVWDVLGKGSRLILQAMVEGETDAKGLASFAVGRVGADQQTLEGALRGKVTAHHRCMLGQPLTLMAKLDEASRGVGQEIGRRFSRPERARGEEKQPAPEPASAAAEVASPSSQAGSERRSWQEGGEGIEQVSGISQGVARSLVAELGVERSQFPLAKHLGSWVGISSGDHASAGKRLGGKTRKGKPHGRRLVIEGAHAAAHSKHSYLAAQ